MKTRSVVFGTTLCMKFRSGFSKFSFHLKYYWFHVIFQHSQTFVKLLKTRKTITTTITTEDIDIVPGFCLHSVEISGFFCHSDFTWNQFGKFQSTKSNKSQIKSLLNELKWLLKLLEFAKLISRKIWVTEKFNNFHTVASFLTCIGNFTHVRFRHLPSSPMKRKLA